MITERAFKALCKVAAAAALPPMKGPWTNKSADQQAAEANASPSVTPNTAKKPAAKKPAPSTEVDYTASPEKREAQANWINQTGQPLPKNLR